MVTNLNTALVLTGGGARAAYQVGFLRCLARRLPDTALPILTGFSAGAINASCLASQTGDLREKVDYLTDLWRGLSPERIFRVDSRTLATTVLRWGLRLLSGGGAAAPQVRALLDTSPLRQLLAETLGGSGGPIPGIQQNIGDGVLRALSITTLNITTGQTVTWVQGCDLEAWSRPARVGVETQITVDHVMASSALPFMFPAVRLGNNWYGDGGVRMSTPLAPAIHLGADRILAISTRFQRSAAQASEPTSFEYPAPAQLAGVMLNAIFLDAIDQDALRLERVNRLLSQTDPENWGTLRPIRLLVLRPSVDLGKLAAEFEPKLPKTFRFLTRGLGTRETTSPDMLSMLMFQSDYLSRLIEIGERDTEARMPEIESWLSRRS